MELYFHSPIVFVTWTETIISFYPFSFVPETSFWIDAGLVEWYKPCLMAPCYIVNNSHTLTKLQTTDLSFHQSGRPIITKLQESWKTKKSRHESMKEAGHHDLSTSKIRRYVLARLCGIPTLQTARHITDNHAASYRSERAVKAEEWEAQAMGGRHCQPPGAFRRTWLMTICLRNQYLHFMEHCISDWLHEFCVARVLLLEEPTGQNCINCWFQCLIHLFREN